MTGVQDHMLMGQLQRKFHDLHLPVNTGIGILSDKIKF